MSDIGIGWPMAEAPVGRVLRAGTAGFIIGCQSATTFRAVVWLSGQRPSRWTNGRPSFGLIYDMNVADDPLVRRLILAEKPAQEVINDQRQNRLLPIPR